MSRLSKVGCRKGREWEEFALLQERQDPGPGYNGGISDSRFFREMGIPCYGLIPVRLGPPDFATIHGVNERVAVMDLKEGTRFLYDLIAALC